MHVCVPDVLTCLPITACGVNSAVSPDAFSQDHVAMTRAGLGRWGRDVGRGGWSKVVRAVVAEALELPAACDLLGVWSPQGSH